MRAQNWLRGSARSLVVGEWLARVFTKAEILALLDARLVLACSASDNFRDVFGRQAKYWTNERMRFIYLLAWKFGV